MVDRDIAARNPDAAFDAALRAAGSAGWCRADVDRLVIYVPEADPGRCAALASTSSRDTPR